MLRRAPRIITVVEKIDKRRLLGSLTFKNETKNHHCKLTMPLKVEKAAANCPGESSQQSLSLKNASETGNDAKIEHNAGVASKVHSGKESKKFRKRQKKLKNDVIKVEENNDTAQFQNSLQMPAGLIEAMSEGTPVSLATQHIIGNPIESPNHGGSVSENAQNCNTSCVTNPSGANPSGTNPSGTNPHGTNSCETNSYGTNSCGTKPHGTNSCGKDIALAQQSLELSERPESPKGKPAPNKGSNSKHRSGKRHQRGLHNDATPSKGGIPKMNCMEYWPLARVEEGIQSGDVITGNFRISQRNYKNAYISNANGESDILIEGADNRNRALQGDFVAVELIDVPVKKEIEDVSRRLAAEFDNLQLTEERLKHLNQQRGRVVRILEKKHCRKAAGSLKQYRNNAYGFALMSPQDNRLPRIMIPLSDCPEEFAARPQDFENVLFTAEISNWKPTCAMASGKLIKQLGDLGEIEPETEGFLAEYSVDDGPFPDDALACLPTDLPWKIPDEEYTKRRDLRRECIFTIDPATARDLDDALSIKQTDDGNFEVGVHIADVSYFIEEGNALDTVASRRATSVYLVQKVVPMLPRQLCEHLCSLNPGDDKLTYSVIWKIAPDGRIFEEWFGRTVIRSCTKLSYDHAQQMIESDDVELLDWAQFPEVDGTHKISDIYACVNSLYKLSLLLRKKRFDSGALNLNQPKLSFTLDKESGQPNGFGSYLARDSNRLVEEFMLLANMAVAHRLMRTLPEHALLRRHPTPHPKMMEDLISLCNRCGVGISTATSQDLHQSLERLKTFGNAEKEAVYFGVVSLCSKPMQLAKYFCAGAIEDQQLYHHYALNVPLYTHFTSPIRRYPDVIVHRMLTVALEDGMEVKKNVQELQKLAEHCNDKKASAKKVQELSTELFFNCYIRQLGELREQAVIIGLLDSAFDVLLLHSGLVKRIYCNSLPLHKWKASKEQKDTMTLYWKDESEADMNQATSKNGSSNGNEAGVESKAPSNGNDSMQNIGRKEGKADVNGSENKRKNTPKKSKNGKEAKTNCKSTGNENSSDDVIVGKDEDEPNGLKQVLEIFDRIEVILKSEEDKGPHRIKVYLPRPEMI